MMIYDGKRLEARIHILTGRLKPTICYWTEGSWAEI